MKVFGLFIFFLSLVQPIAAYEVDDYSRALEWEQRWAKVITAASDRYIQRVEQTEIKDMTRDQKSMVSALLSDELLKRIDWTSYGEIVSNDLVLVCGEDILNTLVEMKTGIDVSQDARELAKSQYSNCARVSLAASMKLLVEEVAVFSLEKARIIEAVREETSAG